MRFRLLENDAVADGVEQGELDAGLVMDLGTAAPVLARTTLRADPACLLVPRGHPFWEKERVPLSALRGQRVLLPSLRQDLFSPLWDACAREGFAPNAEIGPSFYQAYYLVQEQLCTCLTRYEPGARRCGTCCWKICRPSASRWCSGGTTTRPILTCCGAT